MRHSILNYAILISLAACSSKPAAPTSDTMLAQRGPASDSKSKDNELSAEELSQRRAQAAKLQQELQTLENLLRNPIITTQSKLTVFKKALTQFPLEDINSKSVSYFATWWESDAQFRQEVLKSPELITLIESHITQNPREFSARHLGLTYAKIVASNTPPLDRGLRIVEKLLGNPASAELGLLIMASTEAASQMHLQHYLSAPPVQDAFLKILESPQISNTKNRLVTLLDDYNNPDSAYAAHEFFRNERFQVAFRKASREAKRQESARELRDSPGIWESAVRGTQKAYRSACELMLQYARDLKPLRPTR